MLEKEKRNLGPKRGLKGELKLKEGLKEQNTYFYRAFI